MSVVKIKERYITFNSLICNQCLCHVSDFCFKLNISYSNFGVKCQNNYFKVKDCKHLTGRTKILNWQLKLLPSPSTCISKANTKKLILKYIINKDCIWQVAMKHPAAVTACNMELENLITDSNRSIATLAITTLLKVHCPSFITRMMLVEEKKA